MKVYRDMDADLTILEGKSIAVIGYGNQGRAQALNLRDSGLDTFIGNQDDDFAAQAREDGFIVLSIAEAAQRGNILMLLIPDEILPEVFDQQILKNLRDEDALVFASGFNIAFGYIQPPEYVDTVLVAPRMIGAGVRDIYLEGSGFPSFIGVDHDYSGSAFEIALAIAKGIGSTRLGAVQVTFKQEAELDLFTEQCFGPAFGQVLVSAVDLLIEQGYPPEAVLLELYMSGEFSYTLAKIAELGMIEQTSLHSLTSQYGSISRGMRFMMPAVREKMLQGLDEIRSGAFAKEWTEEKEAGYPTLKTLQEAARLMPLYQMETELRQALGQVPGMHPTRSHNGENNAIGSGSPSVSQTSSSTKGWLMKTLRGRLTGRFGSASSSNIDLPALNQEQIMAVLDDFLASCSSDAALKKFAHGKDLTVHYRLRDIDREFYMRFSDKDVLGSLGAPESPANVCLDTNSDILDGMFTGRIDAMRAAISGLLKFEGDTKQALSIQRIQGDLCRLYQAARKEIIG